MANSFSDRAFNYHTDGAVIIQNGERVRSWTRTCLLSNHVPVMTKYMPEWKIGLMVAEDFARACDVKLGADGRICTSDVLTRLFVEQTDDATIIHQRKDPANDRFSTVIAKYIPRVNIRYKSGVEALKILLELDGLWPLTSKSQKEQIFVSSVFKRPAL